MSQALVPATLEALEALRANSSSVFDDFIPVLRECSALVQEGRELHTGYTSDETVAQFYGNMYKLEERLECLSMHSSELNQWVSDHMEQLTAHHSHLQEQIRDRQGQLEDSYDSLIFKFGLLEETRESYQDSVDAVASAASDKEASDRQTQIRLVLSVVTRCVISAGGLAACAAMGPAGLFAMAAESAGLAVELGMVADIILNAVFGITALKTGISSDKRAAETSCQLAQQRLEDALANSETQEYHCSMETACTMSLITGIDEIELELTKTQSLCDVVKEDQRYAFSLGESTKRANVLVQSICGNVETAMLWMETNEYEELVQTMEDMEDTMAQLEVSCATHNLQLTHI